jgi:hypothetical protein
VPSFSEPRVYQAFLLTCRPSCSLVILSAAKNPRIAFAFAFAFSFALAFVVAVAVAVQLRTNN